MLIFFLYIKDKDNLNSIAATQDGTRLDSDLVEKIINEVKELIEEIRQKDLDDPNLSLGIIINYLTLCK